MVLNNQEYLLREALLRLLEIKDSDIRLSVMRQGNAAIDKGIHIGGAFSAIIPLVALYYGKTIHFDFADLTKEDNDIFILSKGHAIAALASIYVDIGLLSPSILSNSRSNESILKGHPGPLLPGVQISTGPLGQGFSVAGGFAQSGKNNPCFDVYSLVGDGELQEGSIWEAIAYASHRKLDNLCMLIDQNNGQLDNSKQLILPIKNLDGILSSFGWRVTVVDATQYGPVINAFNEFKYSVRDGRPTAIICETLKGFGSFSNFLCGHKVTLSDEITSLEINLQEKKRADRVKDFSKLFSSIQDSKGKKWVNENVISMARDMNLEIVCGKKQVNVEHKAKNIRIEKAPKRSKKILYNKEDLPKLELGETYTASSVITSAMKVFARDFRVVSIDSDLSSTSGLEAGVGFTDQTRAYNVGIAESNMMNIGEAFAAKGHNVWLSTFCPFFDWRVLRRIAIGFQERTEVIAEKDGWLSEGHGLDITFLATAPNFETKTNGATHMGNDDVIVFDGIAHLKIIDTSCAQQLLSILEWIMCGNRGLVYLRILRSPARTIYNSDFSFEYGKGYFLKQSKTDRATIISSGREVHEALTSAAILEERGISVGVVDMPSVDEKLMLELYDSKKLVIVAEQNNGFLWKNYMQILFKNRRDINTQTLLPINTLNTDWKPHFIHSATYQQLLDRYGLSGKELSRTIIDRIS